MSDNKMPEQHSSYGMLQFNRTTSRPEQRFFGSEVPQGEYVSMTLHEGSVRRDLNREWYHASATKPLVRLRMTSLAFAELITGMNVGSGVPVTLEYTETGKREALPEVQNLREKTLDEMEIKIKELVSDLKDYQAKSEEIINKKTLNKTDQESLKSMMKMIFQEVESNLPFALKSFSEATGRIVTEAKLEVENAIQHKLSILGLESLKQITEESSNKKLDQGV